MIKAAIIGGTGIYNPDSLENRREVWQETKYGRVAITLGSYKGVELAFIPRHGAKHSVPPHLVNYRANILALYKLGVKNILATAAVGSLNYEFKPGYFVLVDQFLDFTKSRPSTFYEGGEMGVVHCDMTVPYCPELRQAIMEAAASLQYEVTNGGVYVCSEGPRFETAAEISIFKLLGGDVVGMTSVPEVCLARELGMCYATVATITNFAAGISPSILTHSEVYEVMKKNTACVRQLLLESTLFIKDAKGQCYCPRILDEIEVRL